MTALVSEIIIVLFFKFPRCRHPLNNCDVSWLSYCLKTKAQCEDNEGKHYTPPLLKDGSAREI